MGLYEQVNKEYCKLLGERFDLQEEIDKMGKLESMRKKIPELQRENERLREELSRLNKQAIKEEGQ